MPLPGRTLRHKILLLFALPLLGSLLISAGSIFYLIDKLLLDQVQHRVAADLRSAQETYQARLDRLLENLRLSATLQPLRQALEQGDRAALRAELVALRARQGQDLLTAVDRFGTVVARARNTEVDGSDATHLEPVRRALIGEEVASTEILGAADLHREGPDLARQAQVDSRTTRRGQLTPAQQSGAGLVLLAAVPIFDRDRHIIGALYGGDLLNNDFSLVDKIRSTLYAEQTFDGRPLGTATLFLDDVRISTNVLSPGAPRAVGTRVSPEVAEQVLRRGSRWIGRAWVVDDWHLSAYAPLANSEARVVGMLYVGMLERPYRVLVRNSLVAVAAIHGAGLLLVVGLAAVLARTLVRPLRDLARGTRRVAAGDLGHRIEVATEDEIGYLAREFNAMTAALRERDGEIDALTQGLESKVRERSAELERRNEELIRARAETLELMEQQKDTNRELAASLEQLQSTQEELVRSGKLAALGALAAGVAHEINNPLAVVQGNVELLRLQLEQGEGPGEEVELIATQVQRMQRIVTSLLTFARSGEPEVTEVDLEELLADTVALAAPQTRAARVVVETAYSAGLPPVRGNADRLRQVLTNLVVNALQAMPEGGTLRLATARGEDGRSVEIVVADTGVGISSTEQEHIWNPFYTTKRSGTGLGLSICHAIVEEHGGRIRLDSSPDHGTTFTVVLPTAS